VLQVRYVFEGQNAHGPASARKLAAPGSNGEAAAGAEANESLASIKKVLRNVMVHEKSVITSWCSRNAGQMRGALESVVTLQEQADRMGIELAASHQNLRVHRCCVLSKLGRSVHIAASCFVSSSSISEAEQYSAGLAHLTKLHQTSSQQSDTHAQQAEARACCSGRATRWSRTCRSCRRR
jgi:hypothetical protein